MLKVFTTSRETRSFLLSCDPLTPPPYITTIHEFENKAVIYPQGMMIAPEMRLMLMKKACDDIPIELLGFDKDFLYYLKTRDFLFRFFDELAGECVDIADLTLGDTYAFFDDHLRILSQLRSRYIELVKEHGFSDDMLKNEAYELNIPYLEGCGEIELYLQGYLTNFEWEVLIKVSQVVPLKIFATLSRYHKKLTKKVDEFGFEGVDGDGVCINLSTSEVEKVGGLSPFENLSPQFFPVTTRLLQVGMIKEIVYEWVTNKGVDPEKIVVVTPDEGFAAILKEWDDEGLFNLAMGKDEELITHAMSEFAKVQEEGSDPFWKSRITFEQFKEFVDPFFQRIKDHKVVLGWKKELFELSLVVNHLGGTGVARELFYIFLEMVSALSKDDTTGGKIKVMGVLETRGMSFDGVIVVDMNESVVPKPNVKDSFLNSYVREAAGLPTRTDRENLQKLYYDHLFRRSRYQAVGYVENESLFRSRFVDELFGEKVPKGDEASLNFGCSALLLKQNKSFKGLTAKVDTKTMVRRTTQSATSLSTYLACPRKYYWRYGQGLIDTTPQSENLIIGNVVHNVLAQCGQNSATLHNEDEISRFVKEALEKGFGDDVVWLVEKKVWHDRIMAWARGWLARRGEGIKTLGVEIKEEIAYRGITLEGRFDWVDVMKDGCLQIIDFKTSSIDEKDFEPKNLKSFQTVVYYIVGQKLGRVGSVGLMGLGQNLFFIDPFVAEKIPLLDRVIDEIADENNSYEMCDEKQRSSVCRYCPYIVLCGRG